MVRKKKLALNTISSFIATIVSIVCGFIIPQQILICYGSKVNGVVSSITQFLSIINLLELGVGAVVQSSLYKPLVENDSIKISQIMKSSTKYFRLVGVAILIYVIILIPLYPIFSGNSFDWIYTAILIVAMSVSLLPQYYFGISNSILLSADQKSYIHSILQSVTLVINTIACVVLMNCGMSIHTVKLTTSLIYLIRPIVIYLYVKKNYNIDNKIQYDKEPIAQKWNGIAQHIAVVVLDGTDIIVLTMFSTMQNVSIYSVYQLVLNGIKQLISSMSKGIQSLLGELWARQELDELNRIFRKFEWMAHTICVFVFGCTSILILPFVSIYTNGISDANYDVPVFAVLITIAYALYCLRFPYNLMILAGGHYKQTQVNYIVATIINITMSIITVRAMGLIGVAIGTVAAMLYQIIWQAFYISHNLIKWSLKGFYKQITVDIIISILGFWCTNKLELKNISYLSWVFLALEVAFIWAIIIVLVNSILYKDEIRELFVLIKSKFYKHN